MAVAAEIFTDCDYCELPAASKRRVVVRDRATGRPRVRDIHACSMLRQAAGPRTDEAINVPVAAQNVHLAADLLEAQLERGTGKKQSGQPEGEEGK